MHCCANRCIGSASSATHWRTETGVAFARAGRASIETAIAFADEKELFLAWFSGAEVMLVSRVPVWGRAVVMAVSHWSAAAVAVVMVVSQLPRGCVLCAKKFALHGFSIAETVQSSPCTRKIGQNRTFPRCRANFVTAMPSETSYWASFIPKVGAGISVGRFSSQNRPRTPIAGQGGL